MAANSTLVQPVVPQCTNMESFSVNDFKAEEAVNFQPNSWDYYKDVLPSTIPGIVLGALSALCFIFFVIWIMVQYCVCCARGCGRHKNTDNEANAQFIKQEGTYGAAAFGLDKPQKKGITCTRVIQTLIILLTLTVIALSGWGIAESIQYTNTQINNFWTLVDSVDGKVANTTTGLQLLGSQIDTVKNAAQTLKNDGATLTAAATAAGINPATITTAVNALGQATGELTQIRSGISTGISTVDQYMGATVKKMQADYRPPSETFQDKGRYIAIAVMFGLTILAALGTGLLSVKVRHPIWASAFVSLLWLCVALLMLLGVGLLGGLKTVSKDACLYAETFAVNYANTTITDPQKRTWIVNAMEYYFARKSNEDPQPGEALKAVAGVDIGPVLQLVNTTAVQDLMTVANSTAFAAASQLSAAAGGAPNPTVQAVTDLASTLKPMADNVQYLDALSSRSSVDPVYMQVKSLMCCDIAKASDNLWIAWTVVGVLGFVLAALASWRIVRHTFKRKKNIG